MPNDDWRREPQVLDLLGTLAMLMLDDEIGARARQLVAVRSSTGLTFSSHAEVRVHYSYGVNSGTRIGLAGLGSILALRESIERDTQGPVDIVKVEHRTKVDGSTAWKVQ